MKGITRVREGFSILYKTTYVNSNVVDKKKPRFNTNAERTFTFSLSHLRNFTTLSRTRGVRKTLVIIRIIPRIMKSISWVRKKWAIQAPFANSVYLEK